MDRAFVCTDLAWGDCGKGSTVDKLCRMSSGPVLVVRHNGGAQAGHRVVVNPSFQHTFRQFGAGTLAGARTFLGAAMMVNPVELWKEARDLRRFVPRPMSLLQIDTTALVTTPYHVMVNRLRERARGHDRHGSCGMGIGETRQAEIAGASVIAGAVHLEPHELKAAVEKIRDWARDEILRFMPSDLTAWPGSDRAAYAQIMSDRELRSFLQVFQDVFPPDQVDSYVNTKQFSTVVFEGAQGVLLDERFGFSPNTTWSNTTDQNALEVLRSWFPYDGMPDVYPIGIIRAYYTRHGIGAFPTEVPELGSRVKDFNNFTNPWQGPVRAGLFDMELLRYAVSCLSLKPALMVNHMDQTSQLGLSEVSERYVLNEEVQSLNSWLEGAVPVTVRAKRERYQDLLLDQFEKNEFQVTGLGWGPTAADKVIILSEPVSLKGRQTCLKDA